MSSNPLLNAVAGLTTSNNCSYCHFSDCLLGETPLTEPEAEATWLVSLCRSHPASAPGSVRPILLNCLSLMLESRIEKVVVAQFKIQYVRELLSINTPLPM